MEAPSYVPIARSIGFVRRMCGAVQILRLSGDAWEANRQNIVECYTQLPLTNPIEVRNSEHSLFAAGRFLHLLVAPSRRK
jgi:hypothetical protein